jgi:hypothetical protein
MNYAELQVLLNVLFRAVYETYAFEKTVQKQLEVVLP